MDLVIRAVDHEDYPGWVDQLADPLRARRAYWHLVLSGAPALPAVREGLRHPDGEVRDYCTKALDHLVDRDTYPLLVAMLDDPDHRVRVDALHALACDRCKNDGCRPAKEDLLDGAVRLLRADPHKHVRAMAVEVVGRWVHTDSLASRVLIDSRDNDPEPSVRKKAGWYAPGGTIYRRTAPK